MGPSAQQQYQHRGQAVERLLSVGNRQPGAQIPPAEVSGVGGGGLICLATIGSDSKI